MITLRSPRIDDADALAAAAGASDASALWTAISDAAIGVHARIGEADGRPAAWAIWHDAFNAAEIARGGYLCALQWAPDAPDGAAQAMIAGVARAIAETGGRFLIWHHAPTDAPSLAWSRPLADPEPPLAGFILAGDRFTRLARGG